jgi:hypothetical protein
VNRALRRHIEQVERRLAALEGAGDQGGLDRLAAHHREQTRNFQHERLVHLLVTFFFGGLLVAALAAFGVYLAAGDPDGWTLGGLAALCLVLAGLEAAYIGHYYRLENNVQALYGLTARLEQAGAVAAAGEPRDPPEPC